MQPNIEEGMKSIAESQIEGGNAEHSRYSQLSRGSRKEKKLITRDGMQSIVDTYNEGGDAEHGRYSQRGRGCRAW